MKKNIKNLFNHLVILFTLFQGINYATAQTTVNYTADNTTNFPNPERGWWIPSYPKIGSPMIKDDLLTNLRNSSYSVVHGRYDIDAFRTSPFSQEFLDLFQQDFNTCREIGVKMIPLFIYARDESEPDASYDIVIKHLDQIKPILQKNEVVIAYFGTGFIGAWGEWHTSTNNLVDNSCYSKVNSNTIGIHNKILEVLPKSRMTVLRYPRQFFDFYGENALTAQEAFNQSDKARTGFRNHYFSGNLQDGSSWARINSSCNLDGDESLKTLVRNQCAYTVYELEPDTNLPNTDPVYAGTTSLQKMADQRASTSNVYYNKGMIDRWKSEGVFDEMSRRMGYRFKLISSTFPTSINQGSSLAVNFTIKNDGFASPYNARDLELVLKAKSNGAVTRIKINKDPRFWLPDNGDIAINENIAIPNNLAAGQYDLYLNLPDPMASLNTRPEYSIRLANQNTWDAATGYNSLQRSITVNTAVNLSTENSKLIEKSIKLYPNPAKENIILEYSLSENSTVNIGVYNIVGKEILKVTNENQGTGNHILNIKSNELKPGIYFVKILVNDSETLRKLIIN